MHLASARLSVLLLVLLLAVPGAVPAAALAAQDPKVVVIVGPVGEATARFRERAEKAARIAERYTSNVVRLYSPHATWPAVRRALDGAGLVIYLGHGNGWPSRYRDHLYGVTQNGFGLNPVAGVDDHAHQYFGEDRIAGEVRLAPDAIVLLHHLCYASGTTEPGLPEGTVDQARQRIDNYAAGFIRAGAGAVLADAHMGPAWYVEQLLRTNRPIDRLWRSSPSRQGNVSAFQSRRSRGFVASMDPDRPDGGFYRSIVYRGDLRGPGLQPAPPADPAPAALLAPSLARAGLTVGLPYFKKRPVAGARLEAWFPYEIGDPRALDGLTVGVRWDPLELIPAPAEATAPAAAEHSPSRGAVTYVEPERLGDVVEPLPATVGETRIRASVTVPDHPGRYRLVVTFHDASAVAFDAPTQALLPTAVVHVSGELGVRYLVAPAVVAAAGQRFELPVGVANVGNARWGETPSPDQPGEERRVAVPTLVVHWVPLGAASERQARGPATVRLPAGMAPGVVARLAVALTAPPARGSYLLVLDVRVPGSGSLAASGSEPAVVRVTVE